MNANNIPEQWLQPARNFERNSYPCPRCGQELLPYPNVHFCPDSRERDEQGSAERAGETNTDTQK